MHNKVGKFIKSTITGRSHKIAGNYTCTSKNIVYVITCSKCKDQYVGETKNSLRQRLTSHKYDIRHHIHHHKKSTPISEHFNSSSCNIHSLTVQVYKHFNTTFTRKHEELKTIALLQTDFPQGINKFHPLNQLKWAYPP